MTTPSPAHPDRRLLVIGGGITGLAAAYQGSCSGARVCLIEADDRLGGKIRTDTTTDGLIIEHGPDSFVTYRPGASELIEELGLTGRLIGTRGQRKVFMHSRGRLLPMPDGMGQVLPTRLGPFITTRTLGWPDKLRAAADLVLPRQLRDGTDVSIGDFLTRRLGPGIVQRFAEPLVGGIYGASVHDLSLDAVLPGLRANELEHRSLLVASLAAGRRARRSAAGRGGSVFKSLRGGMGELVATCQAALEAAGTDLRIGLRVTGLRAAADGATLAQLSDGNQLISDAVVLACGPAAAAGLLASHAPAAAEALTVIPLASTAVFTLVWSVQDFAMPPTQHGWLEADPAPIGGVTISSAKWTGRAPEHLVLVRAFVPDRVRGGTTDDPDTELAKVLAHLQPLLGASRPPQRTFTTHWQGVMPKYTVGHLTRAAAVERELARCQPTWQVAGSALHGVGLPDCIADGRRAALAALDAVQPTTGSVQSAS